MNKYAVCEKCGGKYVKRDKEQKICGLHKWEDEEWLRKTYPGRFPNPALPVTESDDPPNRTLTFDKAIVGLASEERSG